MKRHLLMKVQKKILRKNRKLISLNLIKGMISEGIIPFYFTAFGCKLFLSVIQIQDPSQN